MQAVIVLQEEQYCLVLLYASLKKAAYFRTELSASRIAQYHAATL